MAVTALPQASARPPLEAAALPPAILVLTLITPALDLLAMVQPAVAVPMVGLLANAVACTAILLTWLRYPHTNWLAAAALAGAASLALRLVGAEVAPVLSLLVVIGLGLGGAFASAAPLDVLL